MFNLLKVEFYKLRKSKIPYLAALVMVVQAFAAIGESQVLRAKSGKDMFVFAFASQDFISLMVIVGVLAADSVTREFTSGYVKNLVAYGHKRRNVYMAKSIACCLLITAESFVFPILITILNTAMNGYGEAFTSSSFLFMLRIALLMFLVYVAIGSIAVLTAFISRNAVVTIGAFICIDTINRVGQGFSLQNWIVKAIYYKTAFGLHNIATLNNLGFGQGLQVVVVSLITMFLSTLIGTWVFKRTEL